MHSFQNTKLALNKLVTIQKDDSKLSSQYVVIPDPRVPRRFEEYYSAKDCTEIKAGEEEPKHLVLIRPFLISGMFQSSSSKSGRGRKSKDPSSRNTTFPVTGKFPFMGKTLKDNTVHRLMKNYENTFIATSTTLPTFAGQYFALSQTPDYTQLAAVFDQYRIALVEAWLTPTVSYNGTPGNYVPFYSCVDYDDSNAPASLAEVQEFQNCQSSLTDSGHYHRFVPHAAVAAYSGTFVSYANEAAPWIDCNSPNVQHYGVKGACSVIGTGGGTYNIFGFFRMTLEFRNSR